MKKYQNESSVDRIIRTVVGLILLVVAYYSFGILSIILYILGAIAIITAASGFCPSYKLFNISTIRK
jgi:hypothetical protein